MAFMACLWRLWLIWLSFVLCPDLLPSAQCSDHHCISNTEVILSMLSLEHIFIHSHFYSSVWIFIFGSSPETFASLPISVHLFCVAVGWVNSLLLVSCYTQSSKQYLPWKALGHFLSDLALRFVSFFVLVVGFFVCFGGLFVFFSLAFVCLFVFGRTRLICLFVLFSSKLRWKFMEIIQHISQIFIQLFFKQAGASPAMGRNTQTLQNNPNGEEKRHERKRWWDWIPLLINSHLLTQIFSFDLSPLTAFHSYNLKIFSYACQIILIYYL